MGALNSKLNIAPKGAIEDNPSSPLIDSQYLIKVTVVISILFVGLGRMGYPMAGHLANKPQFSLRVDNRSPEKITRWLNEHNGKALDKSQTFDVIILCVGNDQDVEGLLLGPKQLLKQLNPGGVIIDHSTTSANLAKKMADVAQEEQKYFLDAPVSGGEAGAIKGALSCMLGGDLTAFSKVKAILNYYCKQSTYIGSSGSGQIVKMANQICVAGTLAGLSEAIHLTQNEGIDMDAAFNAISGGAAQSWQMDNRFKTMIQGEYDFGFAVKHMIKDLNYAIEQAEQQDWQPDISQNILKKYEQICEKDDSSDTSSLLEYYKTKRT